MPDMKLVTVGSFPNRIEADLAQGALEAAGIEAVVAADDAGGMEPGLWVAGVRLLVREDDAAQARDLLTLPNG